MMSTPTARERITAYLGRNFALYSPSAVDAATALLAELLAVAERHGVPAGGESAGWLTAAAAESASAGHRPDVERNSHEIRDLADALASEAKDRGLALTFCEAGPYGVAVEPQPGRRYGLAVTIWGNENWTLSANGRGSRTVDIHAPATPAGAAEVAHILDDLVHGRIDNPLAR